MVIYSTTAAIETFVGLRRTGDVETAAVADTSGMATAAVAVAETVAVALAVVERSSFSSGTRHVHP